MLPWNNIIIILTQTHCAESRISCQLKLYINVTLIDILVVVGVCTEDKPNPGVNIVNTVCGNHLILPPQKYVISKTFLVAKK